MTISLDQHKRQKLKSLIKKTHSSSDLPRSNTLTPALRKEFIKSKPVVAAKPKQSQFAKKLDGAKFRYLNELLYTAPSDSSFEMFQKDPRLFDQYHQGFRSQAERWPVNPLHIIKDRIINIVENTASSNLSQNTDKQEFIVADMGCGEAQLSLDLQQLNRNIKVLSFDLVSINDRITAANIKKVPLPAKSVDVVVFSLSLMGTDYVDFLKEAFRILRDDGRLLVAEVESRFKDQNEFVDSVSQNVGFRLIDNQGSEWRPSVSCLTGNLKMFTFFEFKKGHNPHVRNKKNKKEKMMKQQVVELKACKYKKR